MREKKYLRDGRAPIPEKKITSKIMSSIRGKDTKPEIILRRELWKIGIRGYRIHWSKVPGRPDIAFPNKKIAIFVNGCFWHRCPSCNLPIPKSHSDFWGKKFEKNIERDKRKIEQLSNLDWTVITIWECGVNNTLSKQIDTIKSKLQ